jgi:dipeptide/tripeptide permease
VGTKVKKAAQVLGAVENGSGMSWEKYLKRYVWDDAKTPYFVRVAKMNKVQANNEIFAYALFLAVLFGVISVASLSGDAPQGRSSAISIYAFSVVCGAIFLAMTKSYYAACFCASAPLAALLHFFLEGFHPRLGLIDELLLLAITLAILRYSLRVIAIAKNYDRMPDAANGG